MNLERLLEPRSVALVGASADPKKISGMMVEFLRKSRYPGRVYAVNPRYDAINDWKCYPTVDALPETVDVLVVAVPVAIAFEALEQAARRGVPFVVLMTGGFGEGTSGDEGERRRQRLVALCNETGMRVIGPNTVGMVNFRGHLPLTFADWYGRDTGQRGGVAILTHSGSVGGLIFSSLQINKVGVDFWIAGGNEATLETADFIDWFSDDPDIRIIACFMEGVINGRSFIDAARKARRNGKHVVVLKAGNSAESQRSTRAHTIKSSTAGYVYRGVFEQLGIVQVDSLAELTYAVKLLASGAAPALMSGNSNVGIVSASGGACSVISDHVVDAGLQLPELDPATQAELAKFIPEYGSTKNPVDFSADVVSRRDILDGTFATLATEPTIDAWLVFGRPVIDRYPGEIAAFAKASGKAVIVSSQVALRPEIADALQHDGIPMLDDPELCMRALGAIVRATRSVAGDASAMTVTDATTIPSRRSGDPLAASDVRALLERHVLDRATRPSAAAGARDRRAHVDLRIANDKDFGPLLTIRSAALMASSDAAVARALPLSERELDAAVATFFGTHMTGETVDAAEPDSLQQALAATARAATALYAEESGVAELRIALAIDGNGLLLTDASMIGSAGER